MAESILAVVEKLTLLLDEEARLLKGVKDKVETLMKRLSLMQAVVKDADTKYGGNEAYNCWLSQIRDLGYKAVDVIETYRNESESPGFFNLKIIRLHSLNGEIDTIHSCLEELFKSKDGFSITSSTNLDVEAANATRLQTWREPPAILMEDDYIDLVEDTSALVTQLSSMDPKDAVVSIVGMGGLGKTTLANKLYNHTKLKFECKAFISVSKEYNRKEILYRILEGVSGKQINYSDKEEVNALTLKLRNFLEEKTYLVVLDDLWKKEDWDNLKQAFPSRMGGKVMITTRNRDVAIHAGCNTPLEPRLLSDDESLELLRKKALPQHLHFPGNLKKLGTEMVRKCGGLPLAVVVLGGLLSGKPLEQWENLYGNSRWHIMNDEDRVSRILSLSYNHLPFHLKLCFQHLGLFPEDFCIPKKELIRLWVAERFLPQQGQDSEEVVAENCIHELINRSMVMVGTRTSSGRVKAIRIHDVLRDFSISKAMEAKFLQIYSGKEVGSPTSNKIESRRLAIHCTYNDYAFLEPHVPYLRSLHFFSKIDQKIDFVYKYCKLLNVLEVYGSTTFYGKQDYKVLENLTQLRYLAFKGNTHMTNLPSSLGKLLNLQTLDLRHCVIANEIPDILWKMKRLRHLLLNSTQGCGGLRLDNLIHLRTLTGADGGRWLKRGLVKMIHMRKLGIRLMSAEEANICLSAVSTLHHLQSLSIALVTGNTFPPTLEQLPNYVNVHKLHLDGTIENLKLSNCDYLYTLHVCGKIENLEISNCANLQKLHLNGKIRNLKLSNCVNLQKLQLDGKIEKMELYNCVNFQNLHLHAEIENLELSNCVSIQKLHLHSKIENLELSSCVNLQHMHGNMIKDLKLSNCVNLQHFSGNIKNLEVPNCVNVHELHLDGTIENLKLSYCDHLYKLHVCGKIENLEISNCANLQKLHLNGKIRNLKLSNCVNIQMLQLDGKIKKMELSNCLNFQNLHLHAEIEILELSNCVRIQKLHLHSKIENLELSNCVNLQNLSGNIMNLEVSNCVNLQKLDLHTKMGKFEVSNVNLQNLKLDGEIENMKISNCANLQKLHLDGMVRNLELSNCVDLQHLHGHIIRDLKLSNCVNLQHLNGNIKNLEVSNCVNLQKLSLHKKIGLLEVSNVNLQNLKFDEKLENLELSLIVDLQNFQLVGMMKGPRTFSPNLVKLTMTLLRRKEGLIAVLEKLPRLKMLTLNICVLEYQTKLLFSSHGFPQLDILYLKGDGFSYIHDWTIEEGAMMNLKHLRLDKLYLYKAPKGLKFLTTLQEVDMSMLSGLKTLCEKDPDFREFIYKYIDPARLW